jgi:hypothetical protein
MSSVGPDSVCGAGIIIGGAVVRKRAFDESTVRFESTYAASFTRDLRSLPEHRLKRSASIM